MPKDKKDFKPIWQNEKGMSTSVINRDELPEKFKLLIFHNQYYEEGSNKPVMNYVIVEDDGKSYKKKYQREQAPAVEQPRQEITDEDVPF